MRRRLALLVATSAFAGVATGGAHAQDKSALTAAVRTAVDRGELLYIYDQVAWRGTDDIQSNYPYLLTQAGGYVVTGDQSKTELVFYDPLKSNAVYRATFINGKLSASGGPTGDAVHLSPREREMIAAKEKGYDAIVTAGVGLCSELPPNLTALPPEKPDAPTIVYLMTPQVDMQVFPLGGHFSVEVQSDGSAGKVRSYMNTCLELPTRSSSKGKKPVGFFVTHLLDPTPTEIHVFSSLASGTPIYVMTEAKGRTWAVSGNSVRLVKAPK